MTTSDLISVSDAARLLDIPPSTVKNYINNGDLEATPIGRTFAIERRNVQALAEWIPLSKAASQLGMSVSWVYQRVLSGALDTRRMGRGWFIHRSDVEKLAKERGK